MTPETNTSAPKPNAALWISVTAGALAIVVIATSLSPVFGALLTPAPKDPITVTEQERRVRAYNASFESARAQIQGRSLFFIPPEPPPKPEPRPEPKPQEEEKEPPPPPPPARYTGPEPIAVVFDQVWFKDGLKLRVGDTEGDLQVIDSETAPWSVTLRWKGVEFNVTLLERTTDRLLQVVGEQSP